MKKCILIIFIPFLLSFAVSSCKKKVIVTSTTKSTGSIIMRSASGDPCFPSFGNTNFEMDYEVWGVDANMNPILIESMSQFGVSGTNSQIDVSGASIFFTPTTGFPIKGSFIIKVQIRGTVCSTCSIKCSSITGGKPVISGSTQTLQGSPGPRNIEIFSFKVVSVKCC